jgi:hypothetical protein
MYRLQFKQWPVLTPVIQSLLKNAPTERRDGVCPITAMTQLPPTTPALSFFDSSVPPAAM